MKKSEQRLLFAMAGLVVLGAGVISSDIYFDKRDELEAEKTVLENEWIEIQTLFEEKEIWDLRATWLEQNQPAFTSPEQIDEEIFNLALADDVPGVTTSKQSLLPTERTPHYIQAGVTLVAKGTLTDVFRWIYDITRPESFRVVRNLKVTPDKETEGEIIAQFELLRWYTNPKGS